MAQLVSWGGQDNLKAGLLALAQQYADAGMFSRARDAFKKAGGVWDNAIHRLMKQEAADTTRYGGDIAFKWADYGVRTQAQLDQIIEWAKNGQFGKIEQRINSLGGSKKWNKNLHMKLGAEYLGAHKKDIDPNTPGWQGTTEFKRDEPDVAPVFEPNVTEGVDPSTTAGEETPWRSQFVAPITTGQQGSWSEGQARIDAQKWRNLHMDAAMKKWNLKRGGAKNAIQRSTDISDKDWDDFIKQRDSIISRFKKMIKKPGS
jgi:hypothetical protein|tara:strand:+ start:207 stop:983 length:777 start_codon:yes stop_codon:yes gene_type:complete